MHTDNEKMNLTHSKGFLYMRKFNVCKDENLCSVKTRIGD